VKNLSGAFVGTDAEVRLASFFGTEKKTSISLAQEMNYPSD